MKAESKQYRFFFWRTDFVGVAMIVSGLLFLLVNFHVIPINDFLLTRVLGILFIMGGLIFIFLTGAGGWLSWFAIPAGVFITVGLVTLILGTSLFITLNSAILSSIGLGLTFLSVFITRRNHWWALIAASTFFGIAGWFAQGSMIPVVGWHPVFLIFAVGVSFLVIYLFTVQKSRMRWSLLTGTIIVAVSFCYLLVILLSRWSALWPAALLLIGLLVPVVILIADRRTRRGG
jgi:hypothetical protein